MVPLYRNRPHSMRHLIRHLQDGGTVCIFTRRANCFRRANYGPVRIGWCGRVGAEVVELRLEHGLGIGKLRGVHVTDQVDRFCRLHLA